MESRTVMLLIFAAMSIALAALHGARLHVAVACALVGLALAAGLFLFEIHSPTDGFGLPWLQVRGAPAAEVRPG